MRIVYIKRVWKWPALIVSSRHSPINPLIRKNRKKKGHHMNRLEAEKFMPNEAQVERSHQRPVKTLFARRPQDGKITLLSLSVVGTVKGNTLKQLSWSAISRVLTAPKCYYSKSW